MHSNNCILDPAAYLLLPHMVFIGNVQKSLMASHLKGFVPSFAFCCQGPALTGTCIKKGTYDECPHQLNFRSKRDVLVPPSDLKSRKSCCGLGNPGKDLGFRSYIRDD